MKRCHTPVLVLTTAFLAACGGSSPEADTSRSEDAASGRAPGSEIVVETGGERWTGFDCSRVVRVFASPTSGTFAAVPATCVIGVGADAQLHLEVNGLSHETGTWTGDDIKLRIAVDFEAEGHDLTTRSDRIEPESSVTISTWDTDGLIEGELDLLLRNDGGSGSVRGPFAIAFEVR